MTGAATILESCRFSIMRTCPLVLPAVLLTSLPVLADPVLFPGTGHYYEAVKVPAGITRHQAAQAAAAKGGYLATISSQAENTFVYSLVNDLSWFTNLSINNDRLGPWLGGISTSSGWQWNTGETFSYTNWKPGQPDSYAGFYQFLQFYNGADIGSTWGDHPGNAIAGYDLPRGFVIEYDQAPGTFVPTGVRLDINKEGTNQVMLTWPADATGWTLEYTTNPSLGWQTFPTTPTISNGRFRVPDSVTVDPVRLYRLRQ
ncbi:MAG: hypothetical protein EOP85_01285 [Verrucomicrobiaceae bacterium]|nr:MAG: hypothetical protein EOP85_01285 [Verrucomicrobiaceae bacterium]